MPWQTTLNILMYISLIFSLTGGWLVISSNPRIKLLGVCCYYITNILLFVAYFTLHVTSYLVSGLIYITLSTFNLIRVVKQIRRAQ